MHRFLPLFLAIIFLLPKSAAAEEFNVISITGNFEAVDAVPSQSITDLGNGTRRADLIGINFSIIEFDANNSVANGTLDVVGVEVGCQSTPRQFRQISEYVQFFRDDAPIDKSNLNPYKEWTPVPANSILDIFTEFVCKWPGSKEQEGIITVEDASIWDFVDRSTYAANQELYKNGPQQ